MGRRSSVSQQAFSIATPDSVQESLDRSTIVAESHALHGFGFRCQEIPVTTGCA